MTKREKHEIACTVRAIMTNICDEITSQYKKLNGSLKGLKKYIRSECVEFWTHHDPYLDHYATGIEWLEVGNKIINLDDCWCFIRDGLKMDMD